MAVKVLPEPVAIWTRARGRSALKDSSRFSMAVIWQSRKPGGIERRHSLKRAASDAGFDNHSRQVSGRWKVNTSRNGAWDRGRR